MITDLSIKTISFRTTLKYGGFLWNKDQVVNVHEDVGSRVCQRQPDGLQR